MITKFVLILIISGTLETGKTTVTQEFDSLEQCQFVYSSLVKQINDRGYGSDRLLAGGCFKK